MTFDEFMLEVYNLGVEAKLVYSEGAAGWQFYKNGVKITIPRYSSEELEDYLSTGPAAACALQEQILNQIKDALS